MNEIKLTGLPNLPEGEWSHAEVRKPKKGDWFLHEDWGSLKWEKMTSNIFPCPRLVLVPAKKYREPILPPDYEKECEFSNDGVEWVQSTLTGWVREEEEDNFNWLNWNGCGYEHARIEVKE
jgi:hypothetical protein